MLWERSVEVKVVFSGLKFVLIGDFFCWWGKLRSSGGGTWPRFLTALLYFCFIFHRTYLFVQSTHNYYCQVLLCSQDELRHLVITMER